MPLYNVPISGPNGSGSGTIQVNASDPNAAVVNAQQGGNTPTGGAVLVGGGSVVTPSTGGGGQPGGGGSGAQQMDAWIRETWQAAAEGNKALLDEKIREFDLTFGLDKDKFAEAIRQFNQNFGLAEAGVTGQYQGKATMQQQQQTFSQQLAALNTAAGLQANPFRQQQVIGQLGRILGGQGVAGFSAPNTIQGVGTQGGLQAGNTGLGYMSALIEDIRNPGTNQANADSVLAGIPTPNKINSADFMRLPQSTQQMILQGMQEKFGLDPGDSLKQIQNTLPKFAAPTTFGSVKG